MADPQGQPLDVKKVLEQSASKTTLQELAKKGIHRVKVLDEPAITRMINEAVERILSTRTNLLSQEDRDKLISASRKELDNLMKEFKDSKDREDLMVRDKTALAAEVENLQKQIQLQRKYTDELARQRYEEGKALMKQQVDDLKAQIADARNQGGDEARRAQQSVIDEIRQQATLREDELRKKITAQKEAEFNRRLLEESQREAQKREEFQAAMKQQVDDLKAQAAEARTLGREESRREQQAVIDEIRQQAALREDELRKKITAEKEAEFHRRLLEESQKEAQRREELQTQNMLMSQKLAQSMEEMKKSDEDLFTKLTELFTKSLESLNRRLTDLRLRALAGGPAVGGSLSGDLEFRPSQATIDSFLEGELESNLKQMNINEKTAGKIGSALDRLKALRGTKNEGKKNDTTATP